MVAATRNILAESLAPLEPPRFDPPPRAAPGALVEGVDSLPSMPLLGLRLLEVAKQPVPDLQQIISLVEVDQGMAADLLRIANDPRLGHSRSVTNVPQALRLLPASDLRRVVLGVALRAIEHPLDDASQALWRHALGSAFGASIVARRWAPELRFVAHFAGLIHDAGAALAKRWAFPPEVECALLLHHEPHFGTLAGAHARLVACVVLGSHLADRVGLSGGVSHGEEELIGSALAILRAPRAALCGLGAQLLHTYEVRYLRLEK